MTGLRDLTTRDDSRSGRGDSHMAGGEFRMIGHCCCADGIQTDLYIDTYAHIFISMPDMYGLVALLESTIKLL
jgi:hypothetical protein